MEFYHWQNFQCTYQVKKNSNSPDSQLGLLLIHPIGVGLSSFFWNRFAKTWVNKKPSTPLYIPDLLGCGKSDMPPVAYYPEDWAYQIQYFIQNIVKIPVVLVVQGALFPVAIALNNMIPQSPLIKGFVLSGPPAWSVMTEAKPQWRNKIAWNLFNSPLGNLFYRYARRRKFLESFSVKQLFAETEKVDSEWLDKLQQGADNTKTRYAVFSFLAGFWREDYTQQIHNISKPTLVVVGENATSISPSGFSETPEQRLELYLQNLPEGKGCQIPGRNVLPYESTEAFVNVVIDFISNV